MSFVTTQPEALAFAAGKLQGIGSAMAAQNAAAAAPTTGVVPAAADGVSALQATQFSAYGTLYQQVSAQATAIQQMFVNTLGTSAGSYGDTEASNSAATRSSGLSGILNALTGSGSSSSTTTSGLLNGPLSQIYNTLGGNFGSAASDMVELSALAPTSSDAAAGGEVVGASGLSGGVLAGAAGPAGSAGFGAGSTGFGAAPVSAGVGQASSVGRLSVPPSWAGIATPASSPAPATLSGAGWTTAAPQNTPVSTLPAGMPSVASAGRGGYGFGAPRYGVKPIVMPKPAVV